MTSSPPNDDEYTDYSCSTSIERLARDVETLLRLWHVDKGNDRHISMNTAQANSCSNKSVNKNQQTQSTAEFPASGESSVACAISSSTTTTTSTIRAAAKGVPASALLLRSDTLVWNVSLSTPTGRGGSSACCTVELQLSLWDGPSSCVSVVGEEEESKMGLNQELPHAMRRPAQMAGIAPSLYENMSSLFGIGQHISLSLRQSSTGSNHASSLFQQGGELYSLAQSVLQRHDDETTARLILFQVLSGWLQSALNFAVSNCRCCIPVFGIWGTYHLDQKLQLQLQRGRNCNAKSARPGELEVYPTWMQDILQAELPGIPAMSRKQFGDVQSALNSQHVPPVITGTVLPTVATAGTFWCSVLPRLPKSCLSHRQPRLTLWGNILLKHCPDETVVLWCARHTYVWRKQPIVKASALQMLFQPDSYQDEHENNPHTAWRRTPKVNKETTAIGTTATTMITTTSKPSVVAVTQPQIIVDKSHHIIDLTGKDVNDNATERESMQEYYCRLEEYEKKCRSLGVAILDHASGASASEPRWGPMDDPVAAIHATVTWNGNPIGASNKVSNSTASSSCKESYVGAANHEMQKQPLLSFPLRIRSKQTMTADDWEDMEESVERTILNPLQASNFQMQTFWDLQTQVSSLAATQQCVLAALIRTSTLPDETLLKHITDEAVLEQWDNASGNVVASCLAQQAQVGPTTRALVDAMDWVTSAEDKMEMREAEVLVRHILRPDNGFNFPDPPIPPLCAGPSVAQNDFSAAASVNPISAEQGRSFAGSSAARWGDLCNSEGVRGGATFPANTFKPLFKSAPIGRLVSILCVHMARVRSPCSMAMLWIAFCHEVRMRWDHRILLPHMNYIPEIDPSPSDMKERNRSFGSLGVKAERAAFWHEQPPSDKSSTTTQPDTMFPGDHHCLIGQKLQVVNLCIDMIAAKEVRRKQRRKEQEVFEKQTSFDDCRVRESRSVLKKKNPESSLRVSTHNPATFDDAEKTLSPRSMNFVDAVSNTPAGQVNQGVTERDPTRRGARCPVPGCRLAQTDNQLYAPYLQRPYPLTDDVIAERRMMLSRHFEPSEASQHGVHRRLEISYRLQKPKLLSDMSAFKAANPGSIFQDFINWYGNPGNPLDDYSDMRNKENTGSTVGDLLLRRAATESVALKLDKATEAIQMLNETREFWSRTWEEARAIAASDQKLLFDVTSTVEMALDFMENMHPAILLNQVLAVNMAVSYFTIIEAAKEAGVDKVGGLVTRAFQRLRERTEHALEMLSGDATLSTTGAPKDGQHKEGSSSFISVPVISACDAACSALSEAEVLTARATSLLHKLPGQYSLVQSVLCHEPGYEICLMDQKGQSQILRAVREQQMKSRPTGSVATTPSDALPTLREYVFRNLDDVSPCQLSVRYADKAKAVNKPTRGEQVCNSGVGLLLSVTESVAEL